MFHTLNEAFPTAGACHVRAGYNQLLRSVSWFHVQRLLLRQVEGDDAAKPSMMRCVSICCRFCIPVSSLLDGLHSMTSLVWLPTVSSKSCRRMNLTSYPCLLAVNAGLLETSIHLSRGCPSRAPSYPFPTGLIYFVHRARPPPSAPRYKNRASAPTRTRPPKKCRARAVLHVRPLPSYNCRGDGGGMRRPGPFCISASTPAALQALAPAEARRLRPLRRPSTVPTTLDRTRPFMTPRARRSHRSSSPPG